MSKSWNPSPNTFRKENGYEIDGTWYPRVTSITNIKAKPALYWFYGSQPSYYAAQSVAEKSAEEGTLIHEVAQAILVGEDPEVDPSIAPAIAAFRSFIEQQPIETKAEYIERRIINEKDRYAGTIDILGSMKGKFGVIDIKTSADIYRDFNLQTAAYMAALKPEFPEIETRWILRLDQLQFCDTCKGTRRVKGGREKIKRNYDKEGTKLCSPRSHVWSPVTGIAQIREMEEWKSDYEAFVAAKRLWEWDNEEVLGKLEY